MEIPIEDILKKYTITAPDREVQKIVAQVVNDVVGASISYKSVSYQKGSVYVDTSPLTRSQIHIHKEDILAQISERLNTKRVKNVH